MQFQFLGKPLTLKYIYAYFIWCWWSLSHSLLLQIVFWKCITIQMVEVSSINLSLLELHVNRRKQCAVYWYFTRAYLSRIYMHEGSILLLTREFWIFRSLYLEPFYPCQDLPCNGVSILWCLQNIFLAQCLHAFLFFMRYDAVLRFSMLLRFKLYSCIFCWICEICQWNASLQHQWQSKAYIEFLAISESSVARSGHKYDFFLSFSLQTWNMRQRVPFCVWPFLTFMFSSSICTM